MTFIKIYFFHQINIIIRNKLYKLGFEPRNLLLWVWYYTPELHKIKDFQIRYGYLL